MAIVNIEAVIFDMDGTLVDSELLTQKAVQIILDQHKLSAGNFDFTQCYGITWKNIEAILWEYFPTISATPLAATLEDLFHTMGVEHKPDPIKGAKWAVQEANRVAKTAIGTSSERASLDEVVERLQLAAFLNTTVSGEDYEHSKPAPDCYLLVAQQLKVEPKKCLVFEDSIPGIQAARAAEMSVVAITHRCPNRKLANELTYQAVNNYEELPTDFFMSISGK